MKIGLQFNTQTKEIMIHLDTFQRKILMQF